jgi:tetratricopeptide (TPR) repeat protein
LRSTSVPGSQERDDHREDAALYIGYAEVHMHRGELDKAEDAYTVALRFEQRSVAALLGLTRVYLQIGKLDDATRSVQRALSISPTDAPALKLMGEIYAKRGRFDLAAKQFALASEAERNGRGR